VSRKITGLALSSSENKSDLRYAPVAGEKSWPFSHPVLQSSGMTTRATDFSHLEIPGMAAFHDGPGGLVFLEVSSALATARIAIQGAHITHFQPIGEQPVLFMSDSSYFSPGKPLRGGVPVIFPWFGAKAGDPAAPSHGFARITPWDVESLSSNSAGEVRAVFRLASSAATMSDWPHDFVLRHIVIVGHSLEMILEVENRSEEPFAFEEALHTYLRVMDIHQVAIRGLEGAQYLDKVDGAQRKAQGTSPVRFVSETDRVYLNTTKTCVMEDLAGRRSVAVEKDGSSTTVVWNPWITKSAALKDFGDDEWLEMVCIETANAADNFVTVAPGKTHEMRALLRIQR
jgi:D-hexose-6-phosphate mutarotase